MFPSMRKPHFKNRFMQRTLIFLFVLLLPFVSFSQYKGNAYRGLGAKVLFMNYGYPNGVDSLKTTNGLEISYIHGINNFLDIAVPLKIGVANVPGDINNHNVIGLDLVAQFKYEKDSSFITPYIFGGAGFVSEKMEVSTQIPVGLGFNFKLGKNSYANLQGEYRLSGVDDRNNLQLGVGYIYKLVHADRDGDGINDDEDACPTIPGPKSTKGCPDTDKDGVWDGIDKCPDVAGEKYAQGCPDTDNDGVVDAEDPCPELAGKQNGCPDIDGDGVLDDDDKCPELSGSKENMGCPDSDGDGINDAEDECPTEAGTKENNGCPVADSDGDGFADDVDDCPKEAGKMNGCPDKDGDSVIDKDDRCPDEAGLASNKGCPEIKEEVQQLLDMAMQAVRFETGKATLKTESYSVLNQIVDIMNQYPAYSLSIAGHTDDVGDETNNLLLSSERAQSCYAYIFSKGIDATRMSYAGYGETRPIGDNTTASGRKLNRRVEFNLFVK